MMYCNSFIELLLTMLEIFLMFYVILLFKSTVSRSVDSKNKKLLFETKALLSCQDYIRLLLKCYGIFFTNINVSCMWLYRVVSRDIFFGMLAYLAVVFKYWCCYGNHIVITGGVRCVALSDCASFLLFLFERLKSWICTVVFC